MAVHGSGRTDAGVHALGQCAHVEVSGNMDPGDWQRALNANLPPTIRIVRLRAEWRRIFTRAFQRKGRFIDISFATGPFFRRMNLAVSGTCLSALDLGALRRAASDLHRAPRLRGFFRQSRQGGSRDTARTIRQIALSRRCGLIALTFEGDGFLYKMVRMLTAAMVRVARQREDLDSLRARLRGRPEMESCCPSRGTLPRKGPY